jgi:hypothetical protein
VGLGTADSYSVLGGQTVTNTGPTTLSGDLGVSPGTAITGFPPDAVGGSVHAGDAPVAQAQSNLVIAYHNDDHDRADRDDDNQRTDHHDRDHTNHDDANRVDHVGQSRWRSVAVRRIWWQRVVGCVRAVHSSLHRSQSVPRTTDRTGWSAAHPRCHARRVRPFPDPFPSAVTLHARRSTCLPTLYRATTRRWVDDLLFVHAMVTDRAVSTDLLDHSAAVRLAGLVRPALPSGGLPWR